MSGSIEQAARLRLFRRGVSAPSRASVSFQSIFCRRAPNQMGLLTVLRKVKQKERELRVLIV